MNSIIKNFIQAPVIKMERLDNFFIELSKKACNMKCKHCYIPKNSFTMEKDFLEFKKIIESKSNKGKEVIRFKPKKRKK